MRQWVHDHSLSLAVGLLTASALAARIATAYYDWDDQSGIWAEGVVLWGEATWELLQFLIAVVFTKFFFERGSAESKE